MRHCGEANPSSFLSCWKCGRQRSADVSVSATGSEELASVLDTSPVAGLPSPTKYQFLVALVLGWAPLSLLIPWLEQHTEASALPFLRKEIALNMLCAVGSLVCLVVLRAMGLRFGTCWGRGRYWPIHIALALFVGWVAFWFEIVEAGFFVWSPDEPVAVPDVGRPLAEWGVMVVAVFAASAFGRLLAYGAIVPMLRRILRSGAAAYVVASLLLVLLWNPTGELRWLAVLFGLELLFAAYFHVSKRAWAVALASTLTTLLPWLPHRG
jgi:hypothetical protein